MKKAISWIEFLITFGIFLTVVLFFFMRYFDFVNLVTRNIQEVNNLQKVLILSIYLLNKNISTLDYPTVLSYMSKAYPSITFYVLERPLIIFLNKDYSEASCTNCIKFYYNSSTGEYIFKQETTLSLTSTLGLLLYSTGIIDISNYSVDYICLPYLDFSLAGLSYSTSYKYCEFYFHGASELRLKNIEKVILVDKYRSYLPLYIGGNKEHNKIGSDFYSPLLLSTIFFKSDKNTIKEIYLKVS